MTQQQITAVNHWRGQCLDNFARAERAIIVALEKLQADCLAKIPETASQRTKQLAATLRKKPFDQNKSGKTAILLDLWGYREAQRNALVHGCFTVKKSDRSEWMLLNATLIIKQGKPIREERLMSEGEGRAFLDAIKAERKALEMALLNFEELRF